MGRRAVIALGVLLACCACASAFDPSFDVSQYAHTAWTVRDGFVKGNIYAMTQTPDGYLWLGTEFGLLRFDGVRSLPWQPPAGQHLPALSAYCAEFSNVRGFPVSCETDESVKELSPGAALCIYRIAQEALGNAAKYSEAKKVEVRLTRSDGRVCLSVSDDGVGCTPNQIGKSGGLGLINMRERVRQLDGTCEFDREPGHGTTVRVTVPFRAAS